MHKYSSDVDAEILDFINKNKVATVSCAIANSPYCFSCFYSISEDGTCLIFKSSEDTKHIKILLQNNLIAGTIISPDISMAQVTGIQFEGELIPENCVDHNATHSYYARFPFAGVIPGKIWVIELTAIKYTNTVFGVKHKKNWERALVK